MTSPRPAQDSFFDYEPQKTQASRLQSFTSESSGQYSSPENEAPSTPLTEHRKRRRGGRGGVRYKKREMEKELEKIAADLMSLSADDLDSPPPAVRGIEDALGIDIEGGEEIDQLYKALDQVYNALENDELDFNASGMDTIGRGAVLPLVREAVATEIPPGPPTKPKTKRNSKTPKLRLDLNLDVVVELKARVRGEITLSLLKPPYITA
ncbi:hypothetical protein VNI00_016569 [Paramarasmius palmivorus]|uniref:Uncharacterized protein n=1 Tax=Paramarasmius palmivorus TaxID=297713 RepID=A0AAW0BEZ6_9AGAR